MMSGGRPVDLEATVVEIITDQLKLDRDQVGLNSSFREDLRADSLAIVELVLALEEAFDIVVPDDEIERLDTVQAVVRLIEKSI
jgi:acyl carrier protein